MRFEKILLTLPICTLLFECAAASNPKFASAAISASAEVKVTKFGTDNSDEIYSVHVVNNSSHSICLSEKYLPFSVVYRLEGLQIDGPGGPPDGVDLGGDPTSGEFERVDHSVIFILPHHDFTGVYKISDFISFKRPGIYNLKHTMFYVQCSYLDNIASLSKGGIDWERYGKSLFVTSSFAVE